MQAISMFLSHLGINHSTSSMEKASYEVALKGKKQIAEGTFEFVFEKPNNFQFKSGQHVRMTLLNPPETDSKGNSRFLTLANTPQSKDLVIAMRMTNSAFKRVLAKMKIGEKVLIQILLGVPHGAFALEEHSSKPVAFLVGGIGIAPAYSMIKEATDKKLPQKIYLFYSNRRPEDAPYLSELKNLETENPNFKLIATMTEPEKSFISWKGERGVINQAMLEKYIDDLKAPVYYIAGLSGMVNSMKALVKNLGIDENNIKAEDFDGVKMSQTEVNFESTKRYFLPFTIGLVVILLIIVHSEIFKTFSFQNLSYLTAGLVLVIVMFKLFVIFKFKHKFGLHGKKEIK